MRKLLLLSVLLPLLSYSQKELHLTAFGGFSNYYGELQSKRFTTDQSRGAFSLGLAYEITPNIAIRGSLSYTRLAADDKRNKPEFRERNLSFESQIFEGSLLGEYSLFDLSAKRATPYVFGGGALFRHNPYAFDLSGQKIFLRSLSTEGQGIRNYPDRKFYNLIQPAVLFGAGFRVRITENASLGYEIGVRKTFTDYLDDVSKSYVDQYVLMGNRSFTSVQMSYRGDEIKDEPILAYPLEGTPRGNPKTKDWYYFSGITLTVKLFNTDDLVGNGRSKSMRMGCPRGVRENHRR
jgi:hypothetical protein